jgi:hypothetical protein
MHRLILSGIAALSLLAIVAGGRGQPIGSHQADGDVSITRHSVVAMTETASWWR